MKVSILIGTLDIGGAQRQVMNLAAGLASRGDRVLVISGSEHGPVGEAMSSGGLAVRALARRGPMDLGSLWRLARLLREERPDVLACFMADANVLGALVAPFAPPTPVIMGVRNAGPNCWPPTWGARLAPVLERALVVRAAAVVVNSHRGSLDLEARGFPMDRVHVVANGVDAGYFVSDAARRQSTRQRWGVGDGELLVGLVARLHPQKGVPVFLEAARAILDRRPEARFVVLGDGTDRAYVGSLRRRSISLGLAPRLSWHKTCSDMAAAYNAMDLLVNSSNNEGFPNAVAEALLCGTPCVVTDVGDAARLVGDPRRVVPPNDAGALARTCLEFLAPRREARLAALRKGVVGFDIDTMVEGTRRVYAQCLRSSATAQVAN